MVSKSILAQTGETLIDFSSHKFDPTLKPIKIGINSLTAKILCRRHNSALSPLDESSSLLFKTLRDFGPNFHKLTSNGAAPIKIFSGEDFERWICKTICNFFHAKLLQNDKTDFRLDAKKIVDRLFSPAWPINSGLYVNTTTNPLTVMSRSCMIGPLHNGDDPEIIGAHLFFVGLDFYLLWNSCAGMELDGTPIQMRYRPDEIIFQHHKRQAVIALTWPKKSNHSLAVKQAYPFCDPDAPYEGDFVPPWRKWAKTD